MSHFSVAVFSHHPGEVEELLAPYNEQTEDEEYTKFFRPHSTCKFF